MADDNYNGDLHDGIDHGIESRVVDLVLGEASGSEAEELESVVAEQPEIRAFKQRLESLHGLLGETLVPEDDKEWKLAPERRRQLLEALALAGSTGKIPGMDAAAGERARERRIRRAGRRVMWSAAACFALTLFLVTFLTRPWVAFDSETARGVDDGKQLEGESQSITPAPGGLPRDGEVVGSYPALGGTLSRQKENRLRRVPNQAGAGRRAPEKEVSADEDPGDDAPAEGAGLPSSRPATPEPEQLLPQPDPVAPAPLTAAERAADKRQALHPQAEVKEEADLSRADRRPKPKGRSGEVVPSAGVPLEKRKQRSLKSLEKESLRVRLNSEQAPEVDPAVLADESRDQVSEPPVEDASGRSGDSAPATTGEEKEGRTREVAFLGLGVLLGLFLGLAFGLGLGRTWQRRAHSSH